MAWVRLDDQAPRNRKLLRAGPAACWLWVCGIAHCQSQLTDGFIADEALPMIGVHGTARCRRLADVLVTVGLFDKVDGGYTVHDYLAMNQSKAQVLAKRAADNDRKRGPDSERNPHGIQSGSEASRARVPSHPIPSEPSPTGERAAGGTVLAGGLPREHLTHVACDPSYARCVPSAVHAKLKNLLAPRFSGDREQADTTLRAWYPTIWAALPETFVMPADAFKFWQSRFDPAFASTDAAGAGSRPAPGADATAEYLRQHRSGGRG